MAKNVFTSIIQIFRKRNHSEKEISLKEMKLKQEALKKRLENLEKLKPFIDEHESYTSKNSSK